MGMGRKAASPIVDEQYGEATKQMSWGSTELERAVERTDSATAVVVGIDGSPSAAHTAEWAVDEAVSRDVPLRLIHVIQSTATDIHRELGAAEAALRAAETAIVQTGRLVKVETAVVRGPVAATLVAESVDAAMVCVGATGNARRAGKFVGATSAAVAASARCPVAVIRSRDDAPWPSSGDVAVVIDDSPDVASVVSVALAEARLRNAALLALDVTSARRGELDPEEVDRRLADLLGRNSDVAAQAVPNDIPAFLAARGAPSN
jgi:nucleotide-binding universal stress UspA family protein